MKIENFELKIEKPQNLDNENYVYLAGEEIKVRYFLLLKLQFNIGITYV